LYPRVCDLGAGEEKHLQALEYFQFLYPRVCDLGVGEVQLPPALEFLQLLQICVRDLGSVEVHANDRLAGSLGVHLDPSAQLLDHLDSRGLIGPARQRQDQQPQQYTCRHHTLLSCHDVLPRATAPSSAPRPLLQRKSVTPLRGRRTARNLDLTIVPWGEGSSSLGSDPAPPVQRQAAALPGEEMKRASRVLYPGRPAVVWRVYFGPWEGEGSRASRPSLKTTYSGISTGEVVPGRRRSRYTAISEPETALLLTVGKQGAGAAQRRPRCRASSETSTPDSHSVAAGQGTSNEKPTPWTVPGKRQTSRRLTAWPPATWSRGAGWRPTHAGGDRRPRSPARPCRPFPSLPARPPHRAPVHPARLASRRQASRPCHGHQQAASGPGLPAAPRAGHVVRVDGHARRDRVLNNSATSGRGSARRRRRATGDGSRRESRSVRLRDHWAARARPIVAHHERQAEQTRKPTAGNSPRARWRITWDTPSTTIGCATSRSASDSPAAK